MDVNRVNSVAATEGLLYRYSGISLVTYLWLFIICHDFSKPTQKTAKNVLHKLTVGTNKLLSLLIIHILMDITKQLKGENQVCNTLQVCFFFFFLLVSPSLSIFFGRASPKRNTEQRSWLISYYKTEVTRWGQKTQSQTENAPQHEIKFSLTSPYYKLSRKSSIRAMAI